MKILLLALMLLSSFIIYGQDINEIIEPNKYYDFVVIIDCIENLKTNDSRYIIQNSTPFRDIVTNENLKLNSRILYEIKYEYSLLNDSNALVRKPIDTIFVELTSNQLDSIYLLCTILFGKYSFPALSDYENIAHPIINDGEVLIVTFDLYYRGDLYIRKFKNPNYNNNLNELMNYLVFLIDVGN